MLHSEYIIIRRFGQSRLFYRITYALLYDDNIFQVHTYISKIVKLREPRVYSSYHDIYHWMRLAAKLLVLTSIAINDVIATLHPYIMTILINKWFIIILANNLLHYIVAADHLTDIMHSDPGLKVGHTCWSTWPTDPQSNTKIWPTYDPRAEVFFWKVMQNNLEKFWIWNIQCLIRILRMHGTTYMRFSVIV